MEQPLTIPAIIAYSIIWIIAVAMIFRDRGILLRGVPHLSATGLGLFRIAFGLCLAYGVARFLEIPDQPAPGGSSSEADLWEPWGWVTYLTGHWREQDLIWALTVVAALAFAAGLLARVTYVLTVVGFFVLVLVGQEYGVGGHSWQIHTLVLLGLVLVPWGDGVSVDNVIRRRRGRERPARPPGPHYGIALWIPGLAIGVGFLAAAVAKLWTSGAEWVTGGAVRYHWAEDHLSAPVSLGAWIASQEWLAVAFSAAGVGIEALFITHVLFRSPWIRLGYGLAAAGLLSGFYLFQGVAWFGWWSLLIVFLPWEAIAARVREVKPVAAIDVRAQPRRWGLVLSAFVALALVQQLAITRAKVEQVPLLSNFPMYSSTSESPEDFNREVAPKKFYTYDYVAIDEDGRRTTMTDELQDADLGGALRDAFRSTTDPSDDASDDELRDSIQEDLEEARADFEQDTGMTLTRVAVVPHARIFDFERGRLATPDRPPPPVVVDLDELEAEPVRGELS